MRPETLPLLQTLSVHHPIGLAFYSTPYRGLSIGNLIVQGFLRKILTLFPVR